MLYRASDDALRLLRLTLDTSSPLAAAAAETPAQQWAQFRRWQRGLAGQLTSTVYEALATRDRRGSDDS
jgi:hypothetical protein